MAVKLRMTRMGRRHRPFFRINAVESRTPRDGRIIEKLGHYDPIEKDKDKQIVLNIERVKYWLGQGAIPSDTVSQILLRAGLKHKYAEQRSARRAKAKAAARAKGKFFTKAEKIAAEKAAAEKVAAEKAKAEAEAKKQEKAKEKEAEARAETPEAIKEKTEAEPEKAEPKPEAQTPEQKAEPQAEASAEKEAVADTEEKTASDKKADAGNEN